MHRLDKCRFIINYKSDIWKVETIGKEFGSSIDLGDRRYHASADCKIEEITPHYVRFFNSSTGRYFSEEINFINISWDDTRNKPKIVIRYKV